MLVPLCFLRSQINKKIYRNRHKQAHPRKRRYVDGIHGHRPIAVTLFKGEVLCSSYYTFGEIRNHKFSFQNHKCNDTRPVKGFNLIAILYILQLIIQCSVLQYKPASYPLKLEKVFQYFCGDICHHNQPEKLNKQSAPSTAVWPLLALLRCTSFPQGKDTIL